MVRRLGLALPGPGSKALKTLSTMVIGTAGGILGNISGFPGGALLGALLAVGGYNLMSDGGAYAPRSVRNVSRAVAGATVGSLMTVATLHQIREFAVWAVVSTVALVVAGLLSGLFLERFARLDRATALMASLPGGLAEMSLVAQDIGAEAEVVLAVHVIRKTSVLFAIALCIHFIGGS